MELVRGNYLVGPRRTEVLDADLLEDPRNDTLDGLTLARRPLGGGGLKPAINTIKMSLSCISTKTIIDLYRSSW